MTVRVRRTAHRGAPLLMLILLLGAWSGARAVIASHADFPVSEQVPWRWRRSTEAAGVAVFHQGESGAVVVSLDGDVLVLRGWVDGREVVLRR